jgi:hypothetical protein
MIYLMLVDGTHKAVPEAESAQVEGGQLVCRNQRGMVVEMFPTDEVSAYGTSSILAQDYSDAAVNGDS